MSSRSTRETQKAPKDRLARQAREKAGKSCNILIMLCRRWGDPASVRAARAFVKSMRSKRPQPQRWQLDRIIAELSNGACDVDVSAQRISRDLRSRLKDQDHFIALAQALGR